MDFEIRWLNPAEMAEYAVITEGNGQLGYLFRGVFGTTDGGRIPYA